MRKLYYIFNMNTGNFITKILSRYRAFYHEGIECYHLNNGSVAVGRKFLWRDDTPLAWKPIYYSKDFTLFDYSAYANLAVNKENCENLARDNFEEVKRWDIRNISEAKAEEIMLGNMNALMRIDAIKEKATKITNLMKEQKHGTH